MLSEHEQAGSFIADPPLGSKNLLMAVGTRLGPYEVIARLGAGGRRDGVTSFFAPGRDLDAADTA